MTVFKKLLIGFVAFALAVASAASDYKMDLTQSVQVGGTELKPGTYKFEIQGDKVVFKAGKDVVAQAAVTMESGKLKYAETMLATKDSKLLAISVGGTNMKIVLLP